MKEAFRFYLKESRQSPGWVALAAISTVLLGVFSVLLPLFYALLADKLTAGDDFASFIPLLAGIVVLTIFDVLALVLSIYSINKATLDLKENIRQETFASLAKKSIQFHSGRLAGNLVAEGNKLGDSARAFLHFVFWGALQSIVAVAGIVVVLAFQMPLLLLFLSIASVIYIFVAWKMRKRMMETFKETSEADSLVSAHLSDTLTNIETVISSGQKEQERVFHQEQISSWREKGESRVRAIANASIFLNLAPHFITAPLLVLGVFLATQGTLSVGDLLLILLYGRNLIEIIAGFQDDFTPFVDAMSQSESMVQILEDSETEQSSKELTIKSGPEITLEKVSFFYREDSPLFRDFSLRINQKEKIGLVGRSGAGKSTLVKLLLRLAEPQEGRVLFNEQDISLVSADSLRQQISYVPQEAILFHRTLSENIAYGIDATEEDIKKAARLAHADEFIEKLPDKYDSVVGDRGTRLSGGERQRIILARAFLKNSPTLILDEPTSALDSHSEEMIQDAMGELFQERTTIVIAHRLSTVSHLDRIILLEDGQIKEEGSHEELLQKKSLYSDLWRRQSEGFLPDE